MLGPHLYRSARRFARRGLAVAVLVAMAGVRAGSVDSSQGAPRSGHWKAGHPVPIVVAGGRATFQIPSAGPSSQTLVIVSALSKEPGPFAIRLTARAANGVSEPGPSVVATRGVPRLERPAPTPSPDPVAGWPPDVRTFHLLVRDGDAHSASNYLAVEGRLRAVGRRVQVYVDARDAASVGAELIRDVVGTFDERIHPTVARTMGLARDVDGDGRFTVLLSSWLTRLAGGRHAVDGFVRGADLDMNLIAPFSNRCDMMYLSTTLKTGPHLRTVMAHEYTHAVTFGARVAAATRLGRPAVEEEGWLEEGLAHLAEDLHAFSRSNLDYRVSAFLSRPECYRLVVDDYYTADLFRSHGNRGGTYLFLRWCADVYGPGLLPALIRSERRGIANLEAATGLAFEELYRRWSIALFLGGLESHRDHAPVEGFRSVNPRGTFGAWSLAGPRTTRVRPDGPADTWSAAGTSSHYAVVEASPTGALAIEVVGPSGAELQVTAIPLPDDLARLDLTARASVGPDGDLRLHARIHEPSGSSVQLSSLSWEPLVPAADPRAPGFRRGGLDRVGITSSFGTTALEPHGQLASAPIRLAGVRGGCPPLVLKLVGEDAHGHRVSAWADLIPPSSIDRSTASHDPQDP